MRRCPHCGEPVAAGQERCFACGQSVRARRAGTRGPSPRMLVPLLLLGLLGIAGIVLVLVRRPAQRARSAEAAELARQQDSVRAANRARRQERRSERRSAAAERLNDELTQLETRLQRVQSAVVSGRPTPEQQKLIDESRARLAGLRAAVQQLGTVSDPAEQRRLESTVRNELRAVQGLVSKLGRLPRPKPAAPTGQGTR